MREYFLKNRYLVILWLLSLAAFIVFAGHYTNILLDVGREVYYPQRILEGKVLYKDLFNIYGPFSYLWNALLYKIFGTNLTSLYFSGAVCSLGIVSGIYLIAKKFLNEWLSFALGCYTIVTGICSYHFFNYTFPYSWAMLYGTLSFIYSVFFLLKYKQTDLVKYLYISGLLAGIAAANKYEFIVFAAVLFIISLFSKNIKTVFYFLLTLLAFPILSFGILFLQGLRIEHLINISKEIHNMVNSSTLNYFYRITGVIFTPMAFMVWGISLLKTGFCFTGMLLSCKLFEKHRIISIILMIIFGITSFYFTNPEVFSYLVVLLILVSICVYVKIKNNIAVLLLVISATVVSLKTFWGIIPLNYGNYYLPLVLTAFLSVLFCLINEKYQKAAAIFIFMVSANFLVNFSIIRAELTGRISSPQGTIYTYRQNANAANEVLKTLNNFDENTTALIYPEGLILNFLSKNHIKSDDYYNSLIPLYFESMGEDNFINILNRKKPELVILNNYSTKDYYFEYICNNYAYNFCNTVYNSYEPFEFINNPVGISYKIFRRKK